MTIEVKLKLNESSSEQVQKKLKQLRKAVSTGGSDGGAQMKRVNREVAIEMFGWVERNFKKDGSNVGGWVPFKYGGRLVTKTKKTKSGKRRKNKSATAQSIVAGPGNKRYVNPNAKLLEDTRDLRKGFNFFYTRKNAGVGNDVKYAAAHELGVPKKNLPKRRMLPRETDTPLMNKIIDIYDIHIAKVIRK